MQRVYKYPLTGKFIDTNEVELALPEQAEMLHINEQGDEGDLFLWASVNPSLPPTKRCLFILGTGHPMPNRSLRYMNTFIMRSGLVFHAFEAPRGQ